jgi:hypothetical protein
MEWIFILSLVAVAVWAFFNVNVFWRNQRRADIGHVIKSLLVLLDDGGYLSIRAKGSPIELRVIRDKGTSSGATLTLRVPMEEWSERAAEKLRTLCDAHDYESHFGARPGSDILCEIQVLVDDIWSPSAGASGARLVNLVLDALGASHDVRLKFDLVGPRSKRLIERERALRDGDGQE